MRILAATNWLMNGQLTSDQRMGMGHRQQCRLADTDNVYRYSRNVLFGLNAIWFLGRSGRYTDPYLLSREQRFNELEFTFTYEI